MDSLQSLCQKILLEMEMYYMLLYKGLCEKRMSIENVE